MQTGKLLVTGFFIAVFSFGCAQQVSTSGPPKATRAAGTAATGKTAAGPSSTNAPAQTPSSAPPTASAQENARLSKEQQLANLLRQYRDNQVTPRQYQEQRAKILAEP